MLANLTFFQIVSGDGWSDLARPLIMKHPWTAVLFVGVIFTMVFGMLNLITAVIVDTAAQAREADILHMAAQKEYERKFAWENVEGICVGMDSDEDGNITLEELRRGFKKIPELSAHLSVMGVEFDDLKMVFDILDAEQQGKIPIRQFVNEMYKMQTHEHKTTHVFVKHYVEEIRKDVKMMKEASDEWSKLRDSDDSAKEPETEPKLESPPWMKLYPQLTEIDKITINDTHSNVSGVLQQQHAVPQEPSCPPQDKQETSSELHATVDEPATTLWNHNESQPGISLPKCIPTSRSHSNCSSEDDLEIGVHIGIDDAITQFQNGAFQVLSNAPKSNFAEQFGGKQGNTKQNFSQPDEENIVSQSSHSSTLPILLSSHRQEHHCNPGSPKKC
jgi:Ca2+-binding EF-hand superfamily protein